MQEFNAWLLFADFEADQNAAIDARNFAPLESSIKSTL